MGKIIFSLVFWLLEIKRAMGLYDGPFCRFLLDLKICIISSSFQIWGSWFWLRLMMYMCAR